MPPNRFLLIVTNVTRRAFQPLATIKSHLLPLSQRTRPSFSVSACRSIFEKPSFVSVSNYGCFLASLTGNPAPLSYSQGLARWVTTDSS